MTDPAAKLVRGSDLALVAEASWPPIFNRWFRFRGYYGFFAEAAASWGTIQRPRESAMSYWRTYFHLVWTTKNRHPLIVPPRDELLQQGMRVVARDHGAYVHAVGMVSDHIHVAVSIPPTVSVSEFVRKAKGSTAAYLNRTEQSVALGWFGWQSEFGVFTFAEDLLPTIVGYVLNQEHHHRVNDLVPEYERLGPISGQAVRDAGPKAEATG
ncbi:MAG: IS200/IS605 family transposase [Thermomicrobiales bacterium]|nr:IS200/IS605 family transposase [Thermomicrobiales bacterium]